jgi:hypothetical protein
VLSSSRHGNGREGVAAVEALDPDAILVDLNMPIMNGLGDPCASRLLSAHADRAHVRYRRGRGRARSHRRGRRRFVTKSSTAEIIEALLGLKCRASATSATNIWPCWREARTGCGALPLLRGTASTRPSPEAARRTRTRTSRKRARRRGPVHRRHLAPTHRPGATKSRSRRRGWSSRPSSVM